MSIQNFHEKSVAKAKELADRLGVEFKAPNMKEVEERAKKRLDLLAKYHKDKDTYDNVMNKLLDLVPAKELQSIIQKMLSKKN